MTNYYIEDSVIVGDNVVIEPYAVVRGNTVLRDGCVVGSFSYVVDSVIGENTVVKSSRIESSEVGANCTVGPNAHLREHAYVGDGCRIGNYVEVKKSTLCDGGKGKSFVLCRRRVRRQGYEHRLRRYLRQLRRQG